MGQTYTITKVSQEKPHEHVNSYGTTYYIKVMLDKHNKPVSIGKKQPDALKVGDTVYGRVVPTQYETDNWQGEQPQPDHPAPTTNQAYTPKDQDLIRAQWAIGQAVASGYRAPEEIEANAKTLFAMADRVKQSAPITPETVAKVFTPDPVYDLPPGDEPINLDDIPF